MLKFTSEIREIVDHGEARELVLSRPEEGFAPQVGHCVSVLLPEEGKDHPRIRPYTLASSPAEGDLRLLVDHVEGGKTSTWLHEREVGDAVDLQGPFGHFTLLSPMANRVIWVAEDSGIAPYRGMGLTLGSALSQVTLFHGAETKFVWQKLFEEWTKIYPGFQYHPMPATNLVDRVSAELTTAEDTQIYLCGLKRMTKPLRAHCKSLGFGRGNLRVEKFD